MFDVDKCDWFEIQQECTVCGQSFIADFKYNDKCSKCRHPERILEITVEDEENETSS